jgi:hypothetical protein
MIELVKKFEVNFDIEYNRELSDVVFDFTGEFHQRSVKYMFMKAAEVYAYKNHEYVFYKYVDYKVTAATVKNIKDILNENIKDIIKMEEEHMASVITFIFSSTKSPDLEAQKAIKNFKYYKSFCLGFKGWVNVKLIFINIKTNEVFTNKFARGNEEFFKS